MYPNVDFINIIIRYKTVSLLFTNDEYSKVLAKKWQKTKITLHHTHLDYKYK